MHLIKSVKTEYRPFFILFAGALLVHLFLPLSWSDDAVFAKEASELTLAAFLNGSSRLLTDTMTYVFARHPFLWRMLNPFVLTILAVTISRLLACKNETLKNTVIASASFTPRWCLWMRVLLQQRLIIYGRSPVGFSV